MEGLGKRMFLAHNELERKLGRKVPYAELGRVIARQEGRITEKGHKLLPYSGGNVLRWEQEVKRPSLEALAALAELAGLRKGWLVFGEGPMYVDAEREVVASAPGPTVAPRPLAGRGLRKVSTARGGKRKAPVTGPPHPKKEAPSRRLRAH